MSLTTNNLAIITGASSGIGEATAKILSSEGYDLILFARRIENLQTVKSEIEKNQSKRKIIIFPGDIRSKDDIQKMIDKYELELKNLKVIVNNAGLAKGADLFQDAMLSDWDTMLDTNVKGLLYLTRLALPFLIANKSGHIVNIGSVAGRWVYPGGSVYCASKFAVRAISEGLRQDLSGTGIRVTNIEPGMVETEFSKVRLGSQELSNAVYQGMTPLNPLDIAETISWCLSRPQHVNIQELVVYPTDQAAIRMVHRSE